MPNAFDLMRLGAALLVLFSHAFVLAGRPAEEPVAWLFRHQADGGRIAVSAFFALSGFLIAGSALRHGWRRYVQARAARIWPALAAVAVVQALVMGPVVSALGPAGAWAAADTWMALARTLAFSPPEGLPGVFLDHPLPRVVNGSLWTLRIEALCYLATLIWARTGGRPWAPGVAFAAGLAGLLAAEAAGAPLRVTAILECLVAYTAGATLWCWRDRVPMRGWIAAGLALAALAEPGLLRLAIPYGVLWLGLTLPPVRMDDVSYGAYLVAFPVAQCLVGAMPGAGPYALAAATLPPTLALAILCRRLIERPAQNWIRRQPWT